MGLFIYGRVRQLFHAYYFHIFSQISSQQPVNTDTRLSLTHKSNELVQDMFSSSSRSCRVFTSLMD